MKEGIYNESTRFKRTSIQSFQPDLAFQIGENDIIKFAKTMNHPIYNDIISKFANIPNIKF